MTLGLTEVDTSILFRDCKIFCIYENFMEKQMKNNVSKRVSKPTKSSCMLQSANQVITEGW